MTLPILHFTDILCVWAYVGQVRVDHLLEEQGEHIALDSRFVSVFGDARGRLERSWADRGGLAGYAEHVRGVVARFDHVTLSEKVWAEVAPHSCLNIHLFLAGVRRLEAQGDVAPGSFRRACWSFREAFFRDGRDIGRRAVHYELAEELGLPVPAIEACLGEGEAHADMAMDLALARDYDVKTSPTLLLNEGRERLVGNVGYRVIAANVRELLRHPENDASWC